MKKSEKLRNLFFGSSLLISALGVFIVLQPDSSLRIITYCLGTVIVLLGLIDLITFLINKEDRGALWYLMVRSIAFFILAAFTFVKSEYVSSILPFLFGFLLSIDGLYKIVTGIQIKKSLNTWSSVIILGIAILAVGVIIVLNPFKVAKLTMQVIGVSLILDGVFNIWTQINHRRHVKLQGELIEVSARDVDDDDK